VCEKTSPETTGDVAAGIWGPYLIGGGDVETQKLIFNQYFVSLNRKCSLSAVPDVGAATPTS
jgi:hypothetical protein